MKVPLLLTLAFFLYIFSACNNSGTNEKLTDTPTSGEINITVDESLKMLAEAELYMFHTLYKRATITPTYKAEAEAIADLFRDSSRLAIATRPLTEQEHEDLKKMNLSAKVIKVAYDAVALIVHPENKLENLSQEQLKQLMQGQIQTWQKLHPQENLNKLQLVFDNPNSSTIRYLKEKFKMADSLPSNFFAVNNNAEVVDFISENKNAIGVIGVSWISDRQDSTSNEFLSKIKVLGIAPNDTIKGADAFYQPYQAYIAQRTYPLVREVYVISREARSGLASGFATFIATEKGQLIINRNGLLPATMPLRIREVNLRSNFKDQ